MTHQLAERCWTMSPELTKIQWREYARKLGQNNSVSGQNYVDNLHVFLATSCPEGTIVTYSSLADEVDISGLSSKIKSSRLCLTRTPEVGHNLTVHLAKGPSEVHRFGFTQPFHLTPTVPDETIAAVLVPGLLFDRSGRRLGRGKGYYDRFLARLPSATLRVGITADRVVENLPGEPHDIRMTHLATSQGVEPVPDEASST